MNATENAPAPEAAAPAAPGAQAPAVAPVPAPALPGDAAPVAPPSAAPAAPAPAPSAPAAPALSPEQVLAKKNADLQKEAQELVRKKEDECAAEIAKVAAKYGCELIVGHSVQVRLKK